MEFKKYQHIERFGTAEVDGIEIGECFVFPKIDGTNACVWLKDGELQAGSRKRHLTLEDDNAGFYAWAKSQPNLLAYLQENPDHRLFGEWLVPHSLRTYRQDAWKKFYVFDVTIDREQAHDGDSHFHYLHFDLYQPQLEKHGIDYILPICKIQNGDYEKFINQLAKNVFLIEDGKGAGEGIVIKNYDFRNKYGRATWAKIITSEFKEKHTKAMGVAELKGCLSVEEQIVEEYVTGALIDKEKAKIELENDGWHSKCIPQLLGTVYYSLVSEECWNFVKKHKNPKIDFKRLQQMTNAKIKTHIGI